MLVCKNVFYMIEMYRWDVMEGDVYIFLLKNIKNDLKYI